jgi:hypothetical protein
MKGTQTLMRLRNMESLSSTALLATLGLRQNTPLHSCWLLPETYQMDAQV